MAESLVPLWTMVSTRDSDDTESHGSIITRVTLKITHFLTRRQIHHLGKRHLAVMFSLFQRPLAQSPIDHFLSGDWSVEAKYIHTPTTPPPPHSIYSSCCQWQHHSTQNLLFQLVDQSTLYHTATENQKHTMRTRSATSTQYLRAGSVLVSVGTSVKHSLWLSHTHQLCLGEWLPVNKSIRLLSG